MNYDNLLINQFFSEHSKDAARALEELEPEILAGFFNTSSLELLLEVIPFMSPHLMSAVYVRMNPDMLVKLFESMELHHAVLAVRMMNKELADSVLNRLSEEKSAMVKKLFKYIERSAGSHMDPLVFTLDENLSIKEALIEVKKHKRRIPPQLFVLGQDRKLVGVLAVSDLITGSSSAGIKSIMSTKISTLSPETPVQSILTHKEWENYYALPIVDNASVFLGAIKLETIRSIVVQAGNKGEETGQEAVFALGELYRIGLNGLLRSAADFQSLSRE